MKKAYLYLENGQVLEGRSFGAQGTATGELVFTTSVVGCVESLSDPSYHGQLVTYTFPQMGNYGICRQDMVSPRCQMGGVVVREYCQTPSNFRCEETVDAFLKEQNVVGIAGIDTRMLTQTLRDGGVLNAVITTEEEKPDFWALKAFRAQGGVAATSVKEVQTHPAQGEAVFSVGLVDYGDSQTILASLTGRGCQVTRYPYDTPAETILAAGHAGVVLSNGPGDPADNTACIQTVQALLGKLPLLGIGLGHQILALAAGAKTKKLKFGHRGGNQPARDLATGRVLITTQNHGYAVDQETVEAAGGKVRYENVNDGTCEGIDYPALHAFSLQFDPEAHGGPLDRPTDYDRFTQMMKEGF